MRASGHDHAAIDIVVWPVTSAALLAGRGLRQIPDRVRQDRCAGIATDHHPLCVLDGFYAPRLLD
jgi:hypothetical protein